jgi:hypothetical protein
MITVKLFCTDMECPSRPSCSRAETPEDVKLIETTYNREEDAINCDYYQSKTITPTEDK